MNQHTVFFTARQLASIVRHIQADYYEHGYNTYDTYTKDDVIVIQKCVDVLLETFEQEEDEDDV